MTRPPAAALSRLPLGQRTLVMGILNVTPDSFSDGGRHASVEAAVAHAHAMVRDGADIIDVGGESTRPGHAPVDAAEELRRVEPVIERLGAELSVPISIDTTKAAVARRAFELGATILNDQWGLQGDDRLAATAGEFGADIVAMHNQHGHEYRDLVGDIVAFLERSLECAAYAGIGPDRVVIDPGFGFGKTPAQNLELLGRLAELRVLDRPILIGTSRKSMIGYVLPDTAPDDRLEGTAATVALGIVNGADIVRVHDVRAMKRVAMVADAIVRRTGSPAVTA